MEPTWHRVSATIFDTNDQKSGSFSAIFDYDLGNWTLGIHVEVDQGYLDIAVYLGPIILSLMYWRKWRSRQPKPL